MANDSTPSHLKPTKNNSNTSYTGENGWFVLSKYLSEYGLSFIEAGFFTMIVQLSMKKGYCTASTKYFVEQLGIQDKWIERKLALLQEKKLIFVNRYNTKFGIKRQIVTAQSSSAYLSFLHKSKQFGLLKKFQKEFIFDNHNNIDPPPEDLPSPPSSSEKPCDKTSLEKPCDKMSAGPCDKMSDAYNTTYYPNKKSYSTCKGSDDPVAASFGDLRKELESQLSSEKCAMGLKWYYLQTETQRTKMKNPVACIINAINEGYAKEKVEEKEKEEFEEENATKIAKKKIFERKKEVGANEEFVKKIIEKFQFKEGFTHKLDKTCVVISNSLLEKKRESETMAPYFCLPSGEKLYGARAAIRLDFSDSFKEFKAKIRAFIFSNGWDETSKRRVV